MGNEFLGQALPLTDAGFRTVCERVRAQPAQIWAVLTVETLGFGFLGDRRPRILFERHIFHARTSGRWAEKHPDLSNPRAGGYAGGRAEYDRLERAIALDRDAALCSASWGIGQVMGFNHREAGYPSVDTLVAAMTQDEDAQLTAMACFIQSSGCEPSLRARDWREFARRYNGPAYERNQYDRRLEAAHARFCVGPLPDLTLRAAQAYLSFLGYDPGPIDGVVGRRTRSALAQFQESESLPVSEEADARTFERLKAKVALL
jgi:hypothetical protein